MAMYVYIDAARMKKLLARNAQKQDKANRYYCPNPNCDAHMYIRNIDGISASYFGAIPSHSHIENCPYHNSNQFDPNKYDESKFEFENALLALTRTSESQTKKESPEEHGNGPATLRTPRTIRQIYSMCRDHDYLDTYNGVVIGEMLLDDRSFGMYTQGISGWKIVAAKRKKPQFYDSYARKISLVAPIGASKFTFILDFQDEGMFKEIKNKIYSNRDYHIVVAGQWSPSPISNEFSTTFLSKKQLAIIK